MKYLFMSVIKFFRKKEERRSSNGTIYNRQWFKLTPGAAYGIRSGETFCPEHRQNDVVTKEFAEFNRILGWRGVQAIDRLDKMTDILKSFDSIVRKVDERLGVIERVIKIQAKPKGYGREDIIKDVLERGKIVAAMMKKKKIVAKKKPKRGKR